MNITKLSVWPQLQALGFTPIRYRFRGKLIHTGAALQRQLTDTSGKTFYTDIVTIEPHSYQYSNKRYHITGEVKTPFPSSLHRYEEGKKQEFYRMCDHINGHYSATEILPTVQLMLK